MVCFGCFGAISLEDEKPGLAAEPFLDDAQTPYTPRSPVTSGLTDSDVVMEEVAANPGLLTGNSEQEVKATETTDQEMASESVEQPSSTTVGDVDGNTFLERLPPGKPSMPDTSPSVPDTTPASVPHTPPASVPSVADSLQPAKPSQRPGSELSQGAIYKRMNRIFTQRADGTYQVDADFVKKWKNLDTRNEVMVLFEKCDYNPDT